MKFVSNQSNCIIHAKTKVEALEIIAKVWDYPDYKIYWQGNEPYMLPFVQSRRTHKVYASHSKRGKAYHEMYTRWAV
jgi:sulfatase maturation enzyme AslB (radical SAM superfamily)